MRSPKATVRSQKDCSTDFMLAGAWNTETSIDQPWLWDCQEEFKTWLSWGTLVMWPSSLSTQILRVEKPKNVKMISLSQYPVYPLNNQDTKILCFPLGKKILSNRYNRKGQQHVDLPHSFTLFSSARAQTFRLFARCLWTRTIRQWTFI